MKITKEVLKEAIIDLLDGVSVWYEIRYNTGLPEERCKELERIFAQLTKEK